MGLELKLVSPRLAKLLKEAGFDIGTIYYYDAVGDKCSESTKLNWNISVEALYSAPTLELAKMWLREKHNMYIDIVSDYMLYKANENICFNMMIKKNLILCEASPFGTYEEALEEGLIDACELIKK